MKTLKLNHTNISAVKLANFTPQEGNWSVDCDDLAELIQQDIEEQIAFGLESQTGFKVKVEIFHSNGHVIKDECPASGNFLATRK